MLSQIFYWVLNISIIGSVTGSVVLSLRKIKALPLTVSSSLCFAALVMVIAVIIMTNATI